VCLRSYRRLVLRYKFLILAADHPDTLYVREQGCEDPWLLFEAKGGPLAQPFGKHCVSAFTAIHAKAAFRRMLTDVKILSPHGGDNIAVVVPCSLVDTCRRFGSICSGHPNGGRVSPKDRDSRFLRNAGTYQMTPRRQQSWIISGDGLGTYSLPYVVDAIYIQRVSK
jgi:hypothetical protein